MARYLSRPSYGRPRSRTRNRIYIVSALLIIAVVVAFIYGTHPFGKSKTQTPATSTDTDVWNEPEQPSVITPKPRPLPEPNLSKIAPKPTAQSNPEVDKLIAEAMLLINAKPGGIIEARDILNDALPMPMSPQQQELVKKQLLWLADKWLFSRSLFPRDTLCSTYKVKPGDRLEALGRQFKVPYEILMRINNITRPQALQAGDMIKVIHGPFHARVYRSTFTMDLYLQDAHFIRSFHVGLGRPDMQTPTGLWRVKPGGKLIKPVWTDPITNKTYHPEAPDYPLGSRWIGLEGIEGQAKGRTGFAIHGTKNPEEIGTAGSQGCIRLHNGVVVLVYDLLVPGFSQVRVVE